jgi:hypothetical protein
MGFFDFLKKKQEPLLAVFDPAMTPDDALAAVPGFTKSLMNAVHRFAVQFYRDIHSHDTTGFPAVKEEIFYLLFFATHHALASRYAPDVAGGIDVEMRPLVSRTFADADRDFSAEQFWSAYAERIPVYSTLHASPLVREKLLAAFNAQLLARLANWHRLVTHHSAGIALEALACLEGDE